VQVGNAPFLPNLIRVLRGFDIIHLQYPFFGGEITGLASKLTRTPLIVTYQHDVLLNGVIGVVEKTMRWTVGRLTLRTASRVLFSSLDYSRASYARRLLRGREHTIDELPNGVDIAMFTPEVSPIGLRNYHRLAREDRVALFVAGLDRAHYFKGVDIFLGALAQLPLHIKGIIIGDGDLRPVYASTAERLGLSSRIIFAGAVSDEELRRHYRMSDFTVLPSVTMGEAFGLVLLESMACGTPVIASNLPGVRTVIDNKSTGLLVEPNDPTALAEAMQELLHDEYLRRSMGKRGRAKVELMYDWEQIAIRLETIYRQALSGDKAPRS